MATEPWPEQLLTQLEQSAKLMQLSLSGAQQQMLVSHCQQLALWNKKINLTAITAPAHMLTHHILDSLSIIPYLHGAKILDVGTGGGFPGIPLAIACPDKQFTLLDSAHKKCGFLRHIVHLLQLDNVEVIQERADNFSSSHCFDTIVSRAWTSLASMAADCSHLLCDQGKLINMKGKHPTAELDEVNLSYQIIELKIPGLTDERHLIVMQGKKQ